METKISDQGSSTGLRRDRESNVGKKRLGVGTASMWCSTWYVFMATAALGCSGSFVSDRKGRWQRTGQHKSIAVGARGCWNECGASTGRRGLRGRFRVRIA